MKNIKKYKSFLLEALLPKKLRNYNLLYHSTTFKSFIDIINENFLKATTDYDFGVATSRNKDYIFGRDYDDDIPRQGYGDIQIILDRNKLKNHYKIKAYDWEGWKLTNDVDIIQSEDKIFKSIKDLDKYIIGFHVNVKDVMIEDINVNIFDYLSNWEFFIKKCEENNWVIFDEKWRIIVL